ncbi:MAG: hypothetical protein HC913_00950 [Microscillaceae bacterium]|nr:hypothetical protein [Microscillaceae bacterium]
MWLYSTPLHRYLNYLIYPKQSVLLLFLLTLSFFSPLYAQHQVPTVRVNEDNYDELTRIRFATSTGFIDGLIFEASTTTLSREPFRAFSCNVANIANVNTAGGSDPYDFTDFRGGSYFLPMISLVVPCVRRCCIAIAW